jgi:transcriptional regulator with XRE-family HTH domain
MVNTNKKSIADRLRGAMRKDGMSPDDIANLVGVSRQMIGKYLSGKSNPSEAVMRVLCDRFGPLDAWPIDADRLLPQSRQRNKVPSSGSTLLRGCSSDTEVRKAIEVAVRYAGNFSALGRLLGISGWSVQKWFRKNEVPAEQVLPLCRAADFAIQPHQLRPDLYPAGPQATFQANPAVKASPHASDLQRALLSKIGELIDAGKLDDKDCIRLLAGLSEKFWVSGTKCGRRGFEG